MEYPHTEGCASGLSEAAGGDDWLARIVPMLPDETGPAP
jgi:hypothetical protein